MSDDPEQSLADRIQYLAFEAAEELLAPSVPSAKSLETVRQWLRGTTNNLVGPMSDWRSRIHKTFEERLYAAMSSTEVTSDVLKVATRYSSDAPHVELGFVKTQSLETALPFSDTPEHLE
jgi:hypothetical protein